MALQPRRTIAGLRERQTLTGNAEGAQRVAWTETWDRAREWFKSKAETLPVQVETDAAGNVWTTLRGASADELLIGGHLDSVPNGGWLDGCLNMVAGLEVLRRIATEGTPPVTVRLVDWADEEGARFGKSLFGSSAASGNLNLEDAQRLIDRDGNTLPSTLARYGIRLDNVKTAGKQLTNAKAYIELHIEQGPILESMHLPLGAVVGTVGITRHAVSFTGQTAHAGTTPMDHRRDALGAAAKLALEVREIAKRHGGLGTVGRIVTKPGIVTAVVGQCEMLLEFRHLNPDSLNAAIEEARAACDRFSAQENVTAVWSRLLEMPPVPFHPHLVTLCDEAIVETCGTTHRLPSGALHDACEVARAGIPTAMLFVQSLRGLSHAKEEDTKEEHIELSVRAFDRLATKTVAWLSRCQPHPIGTGL